jgi:hypothetical protein
MYAYRFSAVVNCESKGLERRNWIIPARVCTEACMLPIRSNAGGGLGNFGPASE